MHGGRDSLFSVTFIWLRNEYLLPCRFIFSLYEFSFIFIKILIKITSVNFAKIILYIILVCNVSRRNYLYFRKCLYHQGV